MRDPSLRVYWQPGCTSCLRTKEFLQAHGIEFVSINVREHADAMQELARLGARSVPVVARGTEFVFAQELETVARFVGVPYVAQRLTTPELLERTLALLGIIEAYAAAVSPAYLEDYLPGRKDRAQIDLLYHTAMIVRGFLDSLAGAELTFEHFLRRPLGTQRTREHVIESLREVSAELRRNAATATARSDAPLATYYGSHPLHQVLERTAWHVAQHARQLEFLLERDGRLPRPLTQAELGGLPLPAGVWDREIQDYFAPRAASDAALRPQRSVRAAPRRCRLPCARRARDVSPTGCR
jgi:glutaredoxin